MTARSPPRPGSRGGSESRANGRGTLGPRRIAPRGRAHAVRGPRSPAHPPAVSCRCPPRPPAPRRGRGRRGPRRGPLAAPRAPGPGPARPARGSGACSRPAAREPGALVADGAAGGSGRGLRAAAGASMPISVRIAPGRTTSAESARHGPRTRPSGAASASTASPHRAPLSQGGNTHEDGRACGLGCVDLVQRRALHKPSPRPRRPLRAGDGSRTPSGLCPPPTCRRCCSTPKPRSCCRSPIRLSSTSPAIATDTSGAERSSISSAAPFRA